MTRKIRIGLFLTVVGIATVIAGCATQPYPVTHEAPGFWMGLLHGFLVFFSLVSELWSDHRIYAFPNSGGWYDLGFALGCGGLFGGGGSAARS